MKSGYWMGRYRVPLMVWAWDDKEDIIHPPNQHGNYLVAWIDPVSREIVQSWNLDNLNNFLKEAPPHPDWRMIYTDIPVRTDAEVKSAAREEVPRSAREIRLLKIILTLWLATIPAGIAVLEFLGPEWLTWIGLAFVLWKALKTAQQIWGRAKPSAREAEKAERQRKMDHYFYHCERNPAGFLRLKTENFQNESRELVWREAEELASGVDR